MNTVINFFNHPFFIIVGGLTTILMIVGFLYTVYLVIKGVVPVWYRLGIGLSKRRIAVFGSADAFKSLEASLLDSNIFKGKIIQIPPDNIDKAKDETLFLVDWESFSTKIDQVFSARKNHQTAVFIYAKPNSIDPEKMKEIANNANTVVVNFRGRLLNDILTAMITTGFKN